MLYSSLLNSRGRRYGRRNAAIQSRTRPQAANLTPNVARHFLILCALLAPLAAAADCIQWIQRTNVGTPGSRTSPALAFDSVHGVSVLFGGETTNGVGGRINLTDTWEYDGTTWRQISVAGSSPPGRSYEAMAYDSARGVVMLCGGQNAGGVLKDTWFYTSHGDGTGTWTQGPDFDTVGRTGLAMAFDNTRSVMVVLGGMSDTTGNVSEPFGTLQPTTYEWNGTSWSFGAAFPAGFDQPNAGIARHAMCYDSNEGWVLSAGGLVSAYSQFSSSIPCPVPGTYYEVPSTIVEAYGDFPARSWAVVSYASLSCGGFSQSAMVYDSRRRQSVLFGGSSLTTSTPGTWEYPVVNPVSPPGPPSNAWNPLSLSPQPPARSRHAMAYDSRRGVTVLYGGENASGAGPMSDTWELVPNMPSITFTVCSQQVCQGGTAVFSPSISSGTGSYLYQWQLNGVNLTNNARVSGATNTTLTISAVTTNDAGSYVLTAVDACDNTTFGQAATLIVNYPPTVTSVAPATLALCPGDSGSLTVFYTSPLPVTYQWAQNGLPLPGQTNQQLNFVLATTNQSGLYTVSVSDTCGNGFSSQVPVSVGVWLRSAASFTNTATLCQPESLSVTARGKGTLTSQWFRNGKLIVPDARVTVSNVLQITGDTLVTLHFARADYLDDATYTATITDACGPVGAGPIVMNVLPNPVWIQVAKVGPSSRQDAAIAFDSNRGVTVLFGGQINNPTGSPVIGDTWEFDGTNWTQRLPAGSPAARSLAQMVYDSHRHRTVLFGGQIFNGSTLAFSPETWEWDGNNWQRITTANTPSWTQTYPYAACYDSARGAMLLFGGVNSSGITNQLWSYDGTNWSLKSPAGTNNPVYSTLCSTMAFDTNRGMAVLLGPRGVLAPNSYGYSVWEWDGSAWNERPQSGAEPTLNYPYNGFVYDTFRQQCVLYGLEYGLVGGVPVSTIDTAYPDYYRFVWRWDGHQWAADYPSPTTGVSLQYHPALCFDSARNQLEVFGGLDINGYYNTNYTFVMPYLDAPAILRQPSIQVSLLGQQVQLSVVAGGAAPISYQWQKGGANLTDGGRISGSTTNNLTINPVASGDSGTYQLVLANLCGTTISQPIQLVVTTTPLSIVLSGGLMTITWTDSSAVLQSAPALTGPWMTIVGAMSPYTAMPSGAAEFFRLEH